MEQIFVGGTYTAGEVQDPLYEFTNEDLKSVEMVTGLALVSDELIVDDFIFTVSVGRSRSAALTTLKFGVPVWYYSDDNLLGKFYVSKVLRLSAFDYKVTCVSAIGVLKGRYHLGGIYRGALSGDTVGSVLASIMDDGSGSPIIPYTIDTAVANTYVYGWLPVAPKRENLHQLLFSYAVTLIKNPDGSMRFTFLADATTYAIEDSKIFYGGSVDLSDLATKVEVTEHSFRALPDDNVETLFDNSDGTSGTADHTLVYFQYAPCHNVEADGLTVHELGENYAIVSGIGTLTGQVYTHVTQVLVKEISDDYDEENVRSVTDVTLVTPLNSENVVNRLLAYYSKKQTVTMDIILAQEKCGDQISFTNPYGEKDAGYIVGLDINASSFLRATATVITGYNAQGFGNYFSHAVVLTGSGTFTVPDDAAETMRVVIIGGGDGGDGGYDGTAGTAGDVSGDEKKYGTAGDGGEPGLGGTGGKVYTVDIAATAGAQFAYACGEGGAGGAKNGGEGQPGSATVFGAYSSESGSPTAAGAVDLINGGVYGLPGLPGIAGGAGSSDESQAESLIYGNEIWAGGMFGGMSMSNYLVGLTVVRVYAYGGCGGGAAYGKDGGSGLAKVVPHPASTGVIITCDAGAGASAAPAAIASLGSGGNGGSGGGGGGGGGFVDLSDRSGTTSRGYPGGAGGAGSAGAAGGNGCIIVYY